LADKIKKSRIGPSASPSISFEVREPVDTFTGSEAKLETGIDYFKELRLNSVTGNLDLFET
jgi:hypothetical protein